MIEPLAVPKRFLELYQTLTGSKYIGFNRENIKIAFKEMQICTERLVGEYKGEKYENQMLGGQPIKYSNNSNRDKSKDLGNLCNDLPQELKPLTTVYEALASTQDINPTIGYTGVFGISGKVKSVDDFIDFLIIFSKYIQFEKEIFNGTNHILKGRLGQQQRHSQSDPYSSTGDFLPPSQLQG